ncbi:MAG: peptidoglycan editing factor PgeF [Cytophaga sp.]|uniref:peptidoglycan editing factor PgeF n=1 Tax=Cytophaga sp. TaxID=29535 RepID=UPI003F7DFAC6
MQAIISNNQEHYQFEHINKIDSVSHLVTGKNPSIKRGFIDGLNYGLHVPDNAEVVLQNRRELLLHFNLPGAAGVIPEQTHSCNIAIVTHENADQVFKDTDALITNQKNIIIGVLSADCVPVLLVDPVKYVVASIHAGWRGTVAEIGAKTLFKMNQIFGSQSQDIIACIGPSISQKNYEVGNEVARQFRTGSQRKIDDHKTCIDLWKENKDQLTDAGVLTKNIEIAGFCTFAETDKFYSARRETINTGRMGSFIAIK